jgi:HK97 family phage portal protein
MFDKLLRWFGRKQQFPVALSPQSAWYPFIREPFAGAWQRNMEINPSTASTFYAVFACQTLIARDISKLGGPHFIEKTADGIWEESTNPAYSPVLRKPNGFQTRNQFWEHYILSKLKFGNTYVLKRRDARMVVDAMYVLDPTRVTPLVAKDGSVFYELATDELNELPERVVVPSTEIIHDRFNCLFHPLVGVSPIYASGLAATHGLNLQTQGLRLFKNSATPGGILTAPGNIDDDDVMRIKTDWEQKFQGDNYGRIAVLGSGIKFEQLSLTMVDAQMIEQLKLVPEMICSTFHVPPFKIGVGAMPSYDNVQALEQVYYSSALQSLIEDAEACMDDGLGLGAKFDMGVEFPLDNLLRMDTAKQAEVEAALVGGSIKAPNEGRKKFNLKKVAGGDSIYMQQQNYSLEALAKRDAKEDPFGSAAPPPAPPEPDPIQPEDDEDDELTADDKALFAWRVEKQVTEDLARS